MFAIFTNNYFGLIIGFCWGFAAWCVVIGQWEATEGQVFGHRYSIKYDTLLQQHNLDAEKLEIEAAVKEHQTPQQVAADVMVNAQEKPKNPFGVNKKWKKN